ncbi:uncharacterized protein LOC124148917 isoform X3 [Haliotis rufescens]|uniref:uncharacterized protein LOC124148917 isoform X3 n=1 Tax=Haliotis rufescens TaxID=6454 RepID=UPI00201E781D|nr:uncharacterized protein LOC124148917 isoform X3 [Haliotis rufescens]
MEKRIVTPLVFLAALIVSVSGQTIRLVSPLNNGVGRIEVFYNGTWGTVCDDSFGTDEAKVACRQLGRYKSGLTPRAIQSFGFGGGKILLDDVSCSGTESSLASCSHRPWGVNNCGHSEDVGIICDPSDITMKLTPNYNKGLLQVYHSGRWGTVCDDYFGQVEASVVCRALGYQGGKAIDESSSITMWLDDVQCTIRNTDLKDCKHRPWGSDDCSDSEAVGVQCFSFPEDSTAARLVSTTNTPGEGVLELYHGGQWGSVCYTGFGVEEATVVCRMLGHNTFGASSHLNTGSSSRHVILDKVKCLGTELSLNECLHYPWGSVTCSSAVVRIQCPSANLQIRLNSTTRGRGRVEVLHNNVWGTVCRGSSFSSQEAQVVCKMANLPWTTAYVTTSFGPGEGIIWLSNVDCTGTETSLDQCSHSGWGTATSCSHSSDVGVVCRGVSGTVIHLEPPGSVLNALLGQVISVVCVVDYSNSPVTSFRWTHNGQPYSGQTFSKTVTSKSDSGNLTCSVGNVHASTRINVWYSPVVHLEPRNDTLDVGVGEDLRVQCVVDDANPNVYTFQWSHNGQTSTGSTFLKRNISKSDQGELTCTADNGHMMTPGRAATTIHVTSALVIHLEPQGSVLNVLLGQVISAVCVVDYSNSPVTSFRWTHNGHPYSGQAFSKTVTSKSDSGSLTCSVGNVHASTRINVWYPTVVHLEPQNDTLDVGVGEDLSVRCVVDDGNPSVHTVRWSHNGQTVTGHGSTFLKRNITKSDQGQLTCTADNGHMMTPGRAVATVNVRYPPEIHLSPRQDEFSAMAGDAVEVECVVDDANPAVTSYTWCHNDNISHGQTFMKHVSPDDAGNLSCSATNEQGTSTVQTSINVLQVSSLIGSDDTTSQIKLIAIVTGSVGIVTIIILIIIIIHLRRRLYAAKPEHEPKRSEQTSRADEIPARCCNYETVERPSGGAENTYCEVGLSQTTGKERKVRSPKEQASNDDGNPAHVYGNTGFEDEENIRKKKGTASGTNYGNIQLEMSENIRQKRGKERKVRSPKGQAYNDDGNPAHVYGNTGFEDEENIRKEKGTASGTNYGNIQLEMSENIRQKRGKERKVRSPKGQAYNDEPIYQNTTFTNQSSI